jgi:hypothetical protein
MSEPRFIVTEFVGYPIRLDGDGRGSAPAADYYVQDTLNMWQVLATFANLTTPYHTSRKMLRDRAENLAKRLNAAWDEECARG